MMIKGDRPESLIRQPLIRVALRIGLVVAIATIVSYWHVRSGLERQTLVQLEKYVDERRARESSIFGLAADNLAAFAEQYQKEYRARLAELGAFGPGFRFSELFEEHKDETTRLQAPHFLQHGLTGFIGKHVTITDDLRRRLIVAYELLVQYGPAWRNRFVNLHVVTPENTVLMYWPDLPWALRAREWELYSKLSLVAGDDDVVITGDAIVDDVSHCRWSDLYFDYGVNDWMVSATTPVTLNGRLMLSVSHDILLSDLISRTLNSDIEGAVNMLFRADGRLIAHPDYMDAIQAESGLLTIDRTGDEHLKRIYDLARVSGGTNAIVDNAADEEYLAVTKLEGPEWFLVTVMPKEIINSQAFSTASLILVLGAIALLAEIGFLYVILKKQIARPLSGLIQATEEVASGRFDEKLPAERKDELGQLARSFNVMADEINAREAALNERSASLAELNTQLERELIERHKAEEELSRQREALYQSEKLNALGSLLAGVAHELNNPLSVVVGRSMLLEEQFAGTSHATSIGRVRASAERCAKIVKTFLAMARQEQTSRSSVDIADIVQTSLDVVGYGLRNESITVDLDLPEDLPPISADPNQLIQVFTNLFINAQQAMARYEGDRLIRITAVHREAAHNVIVEFADTGPGIPRDILSRVFEPFFTTKPTGEGTGLGLSLCRGLIEAHGGTLLVRVPDEGGTVFEIHLPVIGAEIIGADDTRDVSSVTRINCHVLVVEDEVEVARVVAETLMPQGHTVDIAATGVEALQLLERNSYDLILSDFRMPEMDGREFYNDVKVRYPSMVPRFIFVTGASLSKDAREFLIDAKRPVIEKPFTPDDLRRVVAEHLTPLASAPPHDSGHSTAG